MKNLIVLIPIMFLAGCAGKLVDGRFDQSGFFPKKASPIVIEEQMEINIGPGPQDEVLEAPPITEVEEIEPSSGWWK